jgi:adenylyl-sulfate kinase
MTLWLTGLSGAGKTTLSRRLAEALRARGLAVEVLDGDIVRENLSKGLGFTKEDRDTNIRRIGFVADLLSRNGVFVIVAAISPYRQARNEVRAIHEGRFVEVWVDCSLDVLIERDAKGLYKKALAGKIQNFTGISDPYEPPKDPEITVRTHAESPADSAARILAWIETRLRMERPRTMRRIAMWSGPRNISTAMMRSWGNRPDTLVCDEPLYAHYLLKTHAPHPGADEVIHSQETDWRKVTQWLTEFSPPDRSIFYQKHMTHHLLPEIDRGWLGGLTHAFLIREPLEVIASFTKVAGVPRIHETGLPQQVELFNWARVQTGRIPPIIDARDVLENPSRVLRLLCDALDVDFTETMLSWPPGPRDTDGVWAKHWYDAVVKTTSFQPYTPKNPQAPPELSGLLDEARELYRQLYEHRLQ